MIVSKKVIIRFIYVAQLIDRLKFKKVGHPRRGGVSTSSPFEDSLLNCKKMFSYKKKS